MKEILKKLCAEKGVSGDETEMLDVVREIAGGIGTLNTDNSGNIIVSLGNENKEKHIMLDSHIDRIGLTATYINDEGFVKAEPVGGIDLRTLPGSSVRILGKEEVTGIVCTTPPHLTKGDEEYTKEKIWIDTGLSADEVKRLIEPGDKMILRSSFTELLNDRIAVSALDNRSGCAVLLRCIQLIEKEELPCRVSFVFSAQEETSELGAGTAAFALEPDEAVVVDVGFAIQDGVSPEKGGKLGCGAIVSISPVLSKAVTGKLKSLCQKHEMNFAYEVSGGRTGTNADKIASSGKGIRTGVISIPSKNMHTQTELVYLGDMEKIARVLADYIMEGGADNA